MPRMASVYVDPARVREFKDQKAFEGWLAKHWNKEPEVWIKMHKKASGLPTISTPESIDVALCWGWIDAIRKSFDETSFLQRFTPRGKKSVWSQVNIDNVARLIQEGRMKPPGLAHVEAAKADGRWGRAYSAKSPQPAELLAAIEKSPKAKAMYAKLSAQNRFALTFRLMSLKTEAGRTKRIAAFVEMLARGETLYPQK
jgi:uncharacterized protein YdeI (YjbR/CyaY-like superfamily)